MRLVFVGMMSCFFVHAVFGSDRASSIFDIETPTMTNQRVFEKLRHELFYNGKRTEDQKKAIDKKLRAMNIQYFYIAQEHAQSDMNEIHRKLVKIAEEKKSQQERQDVMLGVCLTQEDNDYINILLADFDLE